MNRFKNSPVAIAGASFAVAAVLVALGLAFANPKVCPAGSNPEQIDASGCSIGANIGLGLIVLLAVTIVLSGLILAATAARANRPPPPPQRPRSAHQPPPPPSR